MILYLMRHGETAWNTKRLIQGTADIPLNENGILLAQKTRDGFKEAGISFDKILSSPFVRARKTAEIIADGAYPVEIDERLHEMAFGEYEGFSIKEVSEMPGHENMRNFFKEPRKYIARDGCESYEDAAARINEFCRERLFPMAETHKSCLIVCHGAVIRVFLFCLCKMDLNGLWDIDQPNCCVNMFDVQGEKATLLELGKKFYACE